MTLRSVFQLTMVRSSVQFHRPSRVARSQTKFRSVTFDLQFSLISLCPSTLTICNFIALQQYYCNIFHLTLNRNSSNMVQLSNNEVLNSKATSTSRSNMLQPTDDAPPEWPAAKVVYGSATNGTWIEARAYFALTLDEADQLQLMIRHTLRNRGLAGALLGQMKTETKQVVQAVTVQAEYILDGSGHRRWGRAKPPDWDCGGPQQMLSKIVHKDGNTYRKSLIKQQKQQNQESCYGNDATIDRGNSAFVPQESPNFG